MKSFAKLMIAGAALMLASQISASAESLRCTVPFEFQAGKAVLPAGNYIVESNPSKASFVIIRTEEGKAVAMLAGHVSGTVVAKPTSLAFHRYGESYFLREARTGGSAHAWYFGESGREREAAKGEGKVIALIVGVPVK